MVIASSTLEPYRRAESLARELPEEVAAEEKVDGHLEPERGIEPRT